jgi:hypothetical protein
VNEFVNPHHRGVNLPGGFKDLMDVLEAKKKPVPESDEPASSTSITTTERGRLDQVEKHVRQLLESSADLAMLTFIRSGSKVAFYLLRNKATLAAIFAFSKADAIFEHIVRKIFAEQGIVPTSESMGGDVRGTMLTYPMLGAVVEVSNIATEILRDAYAVSESDHLDFLFYQK